jgi:hypothetical protein
MSMPDIFVILALLATIGALIIGVGAMLRGGEYDKLHAEHFMSWRVGLQALTLVFLVLALFVG